MASVLINLNGSLHFLGEIFEDTYVSFYIHLLISFSALVVSSSILTAVGIVAGMIPALRAARLDPVLAMRSE